MTVRRHTRARIGGLLLATLLAALSLGEAARSQSPPRPDATVYRGAAAWVDLYSPSAFSRPEQTAAEMHAAGVRTLYLETANYRQPPQVDIVRPAAVGRLLEAAHAHGISVVAWYLPSLATRARDLRRSLAAIRFTTPGGQRFDSFALDIESTAIRRVAPRNRALLALSRAIRAAVGADYHSGR